MDKVNLVGQQFGKWSVLRKSTTYTSRVHWECKCECGTIAHIRTSELRTGRSKSCGCTGFDDLTGRKFGRWLVTERVASRHTHHSYWKCQCECGVIGEISGASLKNGRSQSCGCYHREESHNRMVIEYGEASLNILFRRYKSGARKRRLVFDLSKEQFRTLTQQSCHYCGSEPRETNANRKEINGKYKGNGIDRINNSIGYIETNCVPCCSDCNYAKGTRTVGEFLSWVKRISSYQGITA